VSISRLEILLSDEGGQGVVELGQGLDVYREAGVPVVSHGVQRQPGQRVVSLQHEPEDVRGVVAVETVNPAAGGLRHEAVVPAQGEVGAVDVEGGLEEDRSVGL